MQNSSSTPDFDSFVPYKRVWWGSQCFTANNPNEPTIINIRRAAPAVCLDTFDNFQISGTPPAYKIPYAAIRKVKVNQTKDASTDLSYALNSFWPTTRTQLPSFSALGRVVRKLYLQLAMIGFTIRLLIYVGISFTPSHLSSCFDSGLEFKCLLVNHLFRNRRRRSEVDISGAWPLTVVL